MSTRRWVRYALSSRAGYLTAKGYRLGPDGLWRSRHTGRPAGGPLLREAVAFGAKWAHHEAARAGAQP